MSESTFLRANHDRIVLLPERQDWKVTYCRAVSIRGSWLLRLFAPAALFQEEVVTPAAVHTLLMRHDLHLTRAESQRLNSMLNVLHARQGSRGRQWA